MAPFYGFANVGTDQSPTLIGMVTYAVGGVNNAYFAALNLDDVALDVWTMTVSSTGPTTVRYVYGGTTYIDTIPASATGAAVVDALNALAAAGTSVPLLDFADIVATGASTWTATGKTVGVTFTMVATSNQAVSHTTTGSLGSDLPQGRGVCIASGTPTSPVSGWGTGPGAERTMKVRAVDNLTEQVQTITFGGTFGAGDQFDATVFCPALGVTVSVPTVTYATSEAATLTALAAAINTQVDLTVAQGGLGIADSTLTCTTGTHTLIATADRKGFAFWIDVAVTNGAAGSAILVSNVPTTGRIGDPNTDLNAGCVGNVPHTGRIVQDADGNPVWQKGSAGSVAGAVNFHMTVNDTDGDAPTSNAPVYMYTEVGAVGAFTFSAVNGAVPLSSDKARVIGTDANGGVSISFTPARY